MGNGVFGLSGVYVWFFVDWEYRGDFVFVLIFVWFMVDGSVLGFVLKYGIVIVVCV